MRTNRVYVPTVMMCADRRGHGPGEPWHGHRRQRYDPSRYYGHRHPHARLRGLLLRCRFGDQRRPVGHSDAVPGHLDDIRQRSMPAGSMTAGRMYRAESAAFSVGRSTPQMGKAPAQRSHSPVSPSRLLRKQDAGRGPRPRRVARDHRGLCGRHVTRHVRLLHVAALRSTQTLLFAIDGLAASSTPSDSRSRMSTVARFTSISFAFKWRTLVKFRGGRAWSIAWIVALGRHIALLSILSSPSASTFWNSARPMEPATSRMPSRSSSVSPNFPWRH